jgi:DNA polymerase-1
MPVQDAPAVTKAVSIPTVAVSSKEVTEETLADLPAGAYGISFGDSVLSYYDGETLCHCTVHTPSLLQQFLDRKDIRVICYDCKQQYKNLESAGVSFRTAFFDVMMAGYVLNSAMGGYDLERLTMAYLHEPTEAGMEAVAAYRMWPLMDGELTDTKQASVFYDIEMPLCGVLCDMELYGFRINRDAIRAYGQVLDTVAADMEQRIFTYAGKQFNINSPKQLGEVLFEELMLPTQKKTKTGYSTNAEVLEKLRKYHPIVEDILEYRQVTKLKSTYVDGLLKVADENGRVHTTFKQTGTATGRLSSAEPNLQNIPIRTELGREMRKFFIPSDESKVLIDADYSQIELRLLAHIAGDAAMQNAFRTRQDIHTDTASRVFGVDPEHVTIELRKKAKAVNFGILYGMGEFSLAEDLHISRAEAKAYIDSYLHSYPNIDEYLKNIVKTAYEQGYVTTLLGRRRLIPEL